MVYGKQRGKSTLTTLDLFNEFSCAHDVGQALTELTYKDICEGPSEVSTFVQCESLEFQSWWGIGSDEVSPTPDAPGLVQCIQAS